MSEKGDPVRVGNYTHSATPVWSGPGTSPRPRNTGRTDPGTATPERPCPASGSGDAAPTRR
jgi:hypothetical protein